MAKKENLPRAVETDAEKSNSITYANEVVATIAGVAAGEVEGIAGMCNVSGGLLKKSGITKGVKVEIGTEEASVDLYVQVEYGTPIQKAAHDAQENVRKAIEAMTGLHVVRVDVHVQGVSFEKENSALSAGQKNAVIEGGQAAKPAPEPVPAPAEEAEEVKEVPVTSPEAEAAAETVVEVADDEPEA
ncbi:MAG: Asp23/Gls24 family envelope stress response protein [Christensenellaceae bacterium]|nr:Asp23/Gls24 family envelope stress response protein [Christensenellaceae bacterium]